MKKSFLQKLILVLCFCTTTTGLAQAPEADIDSITEDSYRRMLKRQAAEKNSDSLMIHLSQPVSVESELKEWRWEVYGVFVIAGIGVLFILWYYRRTFKEKGGLKK